MKCSFLIANYNGENSLLDCLQAVYASSEKDFEVIIADNGSMDDSIVKVKAQFPDARVFSLQENKGVPCALNHAAAQAQGEFLAVIHVDTRVTPQWLENALKVFEQGEDVFAAATLALKNDLEVDSAGYGYAKTGYPYKRAAGKTPQKASRFKLTVAPCNSAAVYRTKLFNAVGGFDDKLFYTLEDMDIGLRAMLRGFETVYTSEAVAYHSGYSAGGGEESDFSVRFRARNTIYIRYKDLTGWIRFKNAWFLSRGEKRIIKQSRKRELETACKQGLKEAYDTVKSIPKSYKGCRFKFKKKLCRLMLRELFKSKKW